MFGRCVIPASVVAGWGVQRCVIPVSVVAVLQFSDWILEIVIPWKYFAV